MMHLACSGTSARSRAGRWLRIGVCVLLLGALRCPLAQPAVASADEVKAAYLSKFPLFVTWPPSVLDDGKGAFVIGVLGADPVYAELSRNVAGRTAQGRPVAVRRLTRVDPSETMHMLYAGPDAPDLRRNLAAVAGKPVLVVTDSPQGLPENATLNFLTVDGKVRFEASLRAADQAGLKLSSRLLGVAERVVGGQP